MLVRYFLFLFMLIGVGACATGVTTPSESSLAAIVEDAREGRIDACRDPRWAEWRFDGGDDGVARLRALQAQAKLREDSSDATAMPNPVLSLQQRARLQSLQHIVRAVLASPDLAHWRSAFDAQEKRVEVWRAESAGVTSSGLAATAARRAVWRHAGNLTDGDLSAGRITEARIALCLYTPIETQAQTDTVQVLIASLDQDHWPSDAADGDGATYEILRLRSSDFGKAYLKQNIKRLDAAAAQNAIPRGGWEYLRLGLEVDARPRAFVARFAKLMPHVHAFFVSLPPPRTTAEDLWRRVRVDQFVLEAQRLVMHSYPRSRERDRSKQRVDVIFADVVRHNILRVKELLHDRDWFDDTVDGEGATRDGWLLVQHADQDRAFQREVLRRLEPLLATDRISGMHYAMLWDRVAVGDKRLQRYGTQMECKDGKRGAQIGLEDPEHVDARRKEMGMGAWDGYVASFGPCT